MANEFVTRKGLISLGGITFPDKQLITYTVLQIVTTWLMLQVVSLTFNFKLR